METDISSISEIVDTGFFHFFKALPQKSDTTLRFFNRIDFYTVHGGDALFVAKEVFKSVNSIKYFQSGGTKYESLVLNKNQFETLIRDLLLIHQYRIEVYSPKGGAKSNDWFLDLKGSPGNLTDFEDIIFDLELVIGAGVMAIKVSEDAKIKTVGVSVVDLNEQTMTVCQFQDDDNFTNLEGFIVQQGPKEVLVPDLPEYKNIIQVANRCCKLITKVKSSNFTCDNLAQDLNHLLQWTEGQSKNALSLPEMKLLNSMGALSAVIKYLELSGKNSNFKLSTAEPNIFVHVDTASARALGLIPQQGSANQETLISFLNKCRTPQGRRLLSQWVKQPLKDVRTINERQDIVAALIDNSELRMGLSEEHLRWFPDGQLLARKFQRKNASLQDCYKIYRAIERIPPLLNALKEAEYCAPVRESFIKPLEELKEDMSKYQEMILSTLDMDQIAKGDYLVKADFSDELSELKSSLEYLEVEIQKELSKAAAELHLEAGKSIKLESTSQHGYHFRSSNKKEEQKIRNNHKFKILDSTNAGLRFLNKALMEYNEDYFEKRKSYDDCQKTVVAEIMDIAAGYVGPILSLNDVIAKLDVLTSFALVAANAVTPYIRPQIRPAEEGILRLKEARHPMLEAQDSISVIPNDIHLEKNSTTFCVITGPNMGGKSTYIRTVGVNVLLTHIGSFVPCQEAEISLKDSILARIGSTDRQSIGVSTFMNEMVEITAILRRATENSLVMIDELGRGTSTYEGCGIAWAIAAHLASEVKAFSLFATHFQELVALADEISSVANFHVTAMTGQNELTMLYKVCPGPSDRSFGIEVAKMAGFQKHIIEDGRQKLTELDQKAGLSLKGDPLTTNEIKEGKKLVDEFLNKIKGQNYEEINLPAIHDQTGLLFTYVYKVYPHIAPVVFPLALIAQTVTVYLTLTVTLERFVAVCHPLQARSLCTYGGARLYVILIIIFSTLYNLPRFLEASREEHFHEEFNTTVYVISASPLRQNELYISIYVHWLYLLFIYFLPFTCLAVLNAAIYRQVRRANHERARLSRLQKKEIGLATMLLCVVIVFFFCNILALVNNLLEAYYGVIYDQLVKTSNLLLTINSSVNFVVYVTFGEKFKRLFLKLFCSPFAYLIGASGRESPDGTHDLSLISNGDNRNYSIRNTQGSLHRTGTTVIKNGGFYNDEYKRQVNRSLRSGRQPSLGPCVYYPGRHTATTELESYQSTSFNQL